MILVQILLLAVGFLMLVKGADWFVDGSAGIAKKMGIPQLVIGLTIVAMGTSAPEAAVSINASLKAIKLFKQNGFKVSLVMLPQGMDPDEYSLKYGADAYLKYFEENIIDENTYIFNQTFLNKNLEDIAVKDEIKYQIFSMLVNIDSKVLVEEFIAKLANKLNISVQAILEDYNNYYNTNKPTKPVEYYDDYNNQPYYVNEPVGVEQIGEKKIEHSISVCEMRLIQYAKSSKKLAMEIDSLISEHLSAFSIEGQSVWITLTSDYYQSYDDFNESIFIKMLSLENTNYYISSLEKLNRNPMVFNDEDLNACIKQIERITFVKQNERLSKNIRNSNNIEDQLLLLNQKFKNKKKLDKNLRRNK